MNTTVQNVENIEKQNNHVNNTLILPSKEAKRFYEDLASKNRKIMLDLDKKIFFLHLSKFLLGLATDHFSDIDYSLISNILIGENIANAKPKYANLAISTFKKKRTI